MNIPEDFEYIVHRPGNPATHCLGGGYPAHPDAARMVMELAETWLQQAPFVGIELTRFKILIIISQANEKPDVRQLGESIRGKTMSIVYQTPAYLSQILQLCPEKTQIFHSEEEE